MILVNIVMVIKHFDDLNMNYSYTNFNFAINLVSDFDSTSNAESDFSSVFMNLDISIFFILYLHFSK